MYTQDVMYMHIYTRVYVCVYVYVICHMLRSELDVKDRFQVNLYHESALAEVSIPGCSQLSATDARSTLMVRIWMSRLNCVISDLVYI